ncbi:MAG: transporter substrate-binding domain-containing protein [Bdellovibrionales bacterium]
MNKTISFAFIIAVAALSGFLAARAAEGNLVGPEAKRETVFERVLRTGTLRCAYATYQPEIIKDLNTGKLSGYIYDIVEEIGHRLNIKIEWTTELGFGFQNLPEDFRLNKFDAFCSGLVESGSYARLGLFSLPIDYIPIYAFVRSGDARFDQSLESINKSSVKIATIDGEGSATIAKDKFPAASSFSLPGMSDVSMLLEAVATGKADVAFLSIGTARGYIEHNPGKIKMIRSLPIKTWTQPAMVVPHGEHDLKYALDTSIREMNASGFIERTFKKYDPKMESYLLAARAYQVQTEINK